ncbi:MAG: hypothetical protein K2K25_04985 [Muribaculaceae bacterium]|nr:hypothetical protein [Muribaculaceae bacterium]
MMEKDLNKQEFDKLIQNWTDDLLAPDIDNQITESLIAFVENDDTEIDVNNLLEYHIHQLALEENMKKRRRWKIFFFSVAAASVAIFIGVSIFLNMHKFDSHTDKRTLTVENQTEDFPVSINSKLSVNIIDSANMKLAKATINDKSEEKSNSKPKRIHAGKIMEPKEVSPEEKLLETIVDINVGLGNMIENANECLSMANVSLLPVNLFSDINESDNYELISKEYSSQQYTERVQKINIIESNLINALYEIRNLNVELNFETENKKTEI